MVRRRRRAAAHPGTDGALRVEATPREVGLAAASAGIPLTRLADADGAGLEEMFLELTADTQRDDLTLPESNSEGAAA